MKPIIMTAIAVLAVSTAVTVVSAQQPNTQGDEQHMMEQHHKQMTQMHGQSDTAILTMPGQDAFGAIQEVVRTLEADPNTDWSKVNLEALRQHLIDMNEVTLKAVAVTKSIEGGAEVSVTGEGRTVEAIQRMVRSHAHEIDRAI